MLTVPTEVPLLATRDWPIPIGPASHPSARSDSCAVAVAFVAAASGQRSGPPKKPLIRSVSVRTLDGKLADAVVADAQLHPAGAAQVPTPTQPPCLDRRVTGE